MKRFADEDKQSEYEERAAILEFDAKMTRAEAEKLAFEMVSGK